MTYHDSFSLKWPSRMWAMQKEIKDAYPKKVCHMLKRHVKKIIIKMHTQRRYATCPHGMSKKREKRCIPKEGMPHAHKACQKKRREKRRKYSPYQKKYSKGGRIHMKEFHPSFTKNIHTSWSRPMTCFSFGSGLWLSKIWEAGCLYILHTYRSTKKSH